MSQRSALFFPLLLLLTACPRAAQPQLSIAPGEATVEIREQQQFAAHLQGPGSSEVTWKVEEAQGGAISAEGLYTAPATAGTYHVVATTVSPPQVSAKATVTVRLSERVHVLPGRAHLFGGSKVAF